MHTPANYECPFCRLLEGRYGSRAEEIIYEDEWVAVFPAKHHKPGNEGHLLVIPKAHIENLYSLPSRLAGPLQAATKLAAQSLKSVLNCDGVTIRQNNEPSGGQDVWHYHVHVVPRYEGDNYHSAERVVAPEIQRFKLAQELRKSAIR